MLDPNYILYDGKESIVSYMKKLNNYKSKLYEHEYNLILNFINEWLNKDLKSITDFKKISLSSLLINKELNINLINKYAVLFNKSFNLSINIDDLIKKDDGIMFMFFKIIKKIDYKIIKYKSSNDILFSVVK